MALIYETDLPQKTGHAVIDQYGYERRLQSDLMSSVNLCFHKVFQGVRVDLRCSIVYLAE